MVKSIHASRNATPAVFFCGTSVPEVAVPPAVGLAAREMSAVALPLGAH